MKDSKQAREIPIALDHAFAREKEGQTNIAEQEDLGMPIASSF